MTKRRKISWTVLAAVLGLGWMPGEKPLAEGAPGGQERMVVAALPTMRGATLATVDDTSRNAFGRPLRSLRRELWQPFRQGKSFFARPRTEIPGGALGTLGGLGPLMNASSCADCHFKDGRGGRGVAEPRLLARLSVVTPAGVEVGPEPTYGGQLQDQALSGVAAEGRLEVEWEEVEGRYGDGDGDGDGDGEVFRLRRPTYRLRDLAYGPAHAEVAISPRMPPALVGLGLLEAVAEDDILAWADAEDLDGDGISGRANRVPDRRSGGTALGRFGWKAGQPTLEQQNSAALAQDLGVTNGLYPGDICSAVQEDCRHRSPAGVVEATPHQVQRLTLYTRLLAVPAARGVENPEVDRGRLSFAEFGCARCHRPHMVTGSAAELPELRRQEIEPYSDLLLHDLGEELSDQRPDHLASGREWRTPPLWGLGLLKTVSGTVRLLHDGRARSAEEAILWHGGEAAKSREAFRQARAEERRSLLRFLESL